MLSEIDNYLSGQTPTDRVGIVCGGVTGFGCPASYPCSSGPELEARGASRCHQEH